LVAAGESEGVHGKLVADSAAQFERDFILSQGAKAMERVSQQLQGEQVMNDSPRNVHQARRLNRDSH
jgi:hypothetical protein